MSHIDISKTKKLCEYDLDYFLNKIDFSTQTTNDMSKIKIDLYCASCSKIGEAKSQNLLTFIKYTTSICENKKLCDFCNKEYISNMLLRYNDSIICYHCLFWLNYDVSQRCNVDGVYGLTIAEYINNFREDHKKEICIRPLQCFLCDNLNGKIIENIIDGDLINNEMIDISDDEYEIKIEI